MAEVKTTWLYLFSCLLVNRTSALKRGFQDVASAALFDDYSDPARSR